MEDEWEEEEQLVLVELSGIIDSDFLTKSEGQCKIVGIDTEQPMMQVGAYVFAGEYEDVLGTCVIFDETDAGDKESSPQLQYKCHTVKKLMMQRTFLSEKKEGEPSSGIEVLQLNDSEFLGRNSTVCSFIQNPKKKWGGTRTFSSPSPSGSGSEAEASDSEQPGLGCGVLESASGHQEAGSEMKTQSDVVTPAE
ncbi:general transcription factor 3C polypeptide 6 [Paramormyrops kingsleyae]|uniref:general transcription factor 3C polypeptide 6 n=1 Tax=Paramormyrops kingsleyae TaxID=1676925 RepID=UPI000CD61B73|nr:general transcription factor 3C polypeptide 6 [Paramormyrops kingsleyae]